MVFNPKKCKVLEMGKGTMRPSWDYKMGNDTLGKPEEEKDLGIIIQKDLSPEKHIRKITRETYKLLINIRVAFHYMDEEMMKKLILAVIRPRLEYAAVVWSPHKVKHIRKIERIQRAATKMVPSLRDLTYEERLAKLNLPSLEERRERGDLITVYKAMREMEKIDRDDLFVWDTRETRGHGKKLKKTRCLRSIKKHGFPYRCIDTWNGLEKDILNARNIHEFKDKLDNSRYRDRTQRA